MAEADLLGGGDAFAFIGAVAAVAFLLGAARYLYLRMQRNKSVTTVGLDYAERSPSTDVSSVAEHSAHIVNPCDGRVYITLTPDELLAIGTDETSLVAHGLKKPYLGKWIRVEGKVDDINRYTSGKFIVTIDITDSSYMSLRFDERWGEYLETMGKDFYIVAHGKIDEIERYGLWIEECELENYGRVSPDT